MSTAKQAWKYIRYADAGDYVKNPANGKEIVKTSRDADTLYFECNCYYKGHYVGRKYGRDAFLWLMQ